MLVETTKSQWDDDKCRRDAGFFKECTIFYRSFVLLVYLTVSKLYLLADIHMNVC